MICEMEGPRLLWFFAFSVHLRNNHPEHLGFSDPGKYLCSRFVRMSSSFQMILEGEGMDGAICLMVLVATMYVSRYVFV